jgi:hypothetical protein
MTQIKNMIENEIKTEKYIEHYKVKDHPGNPADMVHTINPGNPAQSIN